MNTINLNDLHDIDGGATIREATDFLWDLGCYEAAYNMRTGVDATVGC